MSIHVHRKDLINTQQMEVAVNGPDGANYLILCTGVANLGYGRHETYTFLVGPQLSRRQFVGAIGSGVLAIIQTQGNKSVGENGNTDPRTNLVLINVNYDDESGQVKVSAEVSPILEMTKLAISYNVSILAELPTY